MFGDWLEVSRHGKFVEWVRDSETGLYVLEAVRDETRTPLIPRPVAIMEWALKAARGDASVQKGGRIEYRNGPWYKSVRGKRQGTRMQKATASAYGRGPFGPTARLQ